MRIVTLKDELMSLLVMGPGQVIFLWLGSGWVSHLWFGFEFGKFPLKMSIFCPSGEKNLFGSSQRWVGLLFTAGQT